MDRRAGWGCSGSGGVNGLAFCLPVVTLNPHLSKLTDSPFDPASTYQYLTKYCASKGSFVFFLLFIFWFERRCNMSGCFAVHK